MVFIVRDFETVKQCMAYSRLVMYRIIEHPDHVEVRIKAGSVAWVGTFSKDDPKLKQVKELLKTYEAVEVLSTMPDELFMS